MDPPTNCGHLRDPRLCPLHEWENHVCTPSVQVGLTVAFFLAKFSILFEMKNIFKALSFPEVMEEPFLQDPCQIVRQVLILEMSVLLSD